ncbi:MAG: response regulator [Spirochaetes bacterium]|nr:MAG: response regulator [Spirochaetota bacterium]
MAQETPARILTIEDEDIVRINIAAYLEDHGFSVLQAANGREGLDMFRAEKPDLVLVDLRMPEINGLQVLGHVAVEAPEIPVIIVSGTGIMRDAIEALRLGAWDFVTKPIQDMEVLKYSIMKSLERASLLRENRIYKEHLEDEIKKRTAELRETNYMLKEEILERWKVEEELRKSITTLQKTITGIVHTISLIGEIRDPYTGGHQRRVAELARAIGEELGLDEDRLQGVFVAGMLHDIGKISVPIEILCKPSGITEIESMMLKTHPEVSWEILREIEFPWPVARIVLQHHERMDGSGFPGGLKGEDILLEARIIGVADVVEAMASHRPYRPALGIDKAIEEIIAKKNSYYDPAAVDACVRLFREKGYTLDSHKTGFEGRIPLGA